MRCNDCEDDNDDGDDDDDEGCYADDGADDTMMEHMLGFNPGHPVKGGCSPWHTVGRDQR